MNELCGVPNGSLNVRDPTSSCMRSMWFTIVHLGVTFWAAPTSIISTKKSTPAPNLLMRVPKNGVIVKHRKPENKSVDGSI